MIKTSTKQLTCKQLLESRLKRIPFFVKTLAARIPQKPLPKKIGNPSDGSSTKYEKIHTVGNKKN